MVQQVLSEHNKAVDSALEKSLQAILASGLTRRERRLDASLMRRNVYSNGKSEWFYKNKMIMISIMPEVIREEVITSGSVEIVDDKIT